MSDRGGDGVSGWVPVTAGRSGARVWRGRGVHRKQGDPAAIDAEAERLVWLARHGVPVPEIVAHGPGELVTATVAGRTGADDWPVALHGRLADEFGGLLRDLHALPVAECPFRRPLAVQLAAAEANGAVDLDDLDDERHGWDLERLRAALRAGAGTATAAEPRGLVVTHGDPTLENVLFTAGGRVAGIVDVGAAGVADRHADLAIAHRDVTGAWSAAAGARLLRAYGHPADAGLLAFYRLLDEFG